MKRIIAFLLVVSLTAAIAIGGTLAFLTDRDSEANVFTVGDVKIDLEEDFEQGAELIPGVNIEKKPTVTNVGPNNAWVWVEIAVPSALNDTTSASSNALHFNMSKESVADGKWNWWDGADYSEGAYFIRNETIDEVEYDVYVVQYETALKAGETTEPVIYKVYLDSRVDIDPEGNWALVDGGNVTPIDWNSNDDGAPVIYVSAYAMQTEGFGSVYAAYEAYQTQWSDNGSEYADPVDPDATLVDTFDKLKAAVANGGSIALAADIEVTSSFNVSKDVVLYAKSGAELSFAPAAQMKVQDGATLELKGVTVDNGDTFSFGADNKLAIADLDGRKTNAAFDVAAGSKLIVGEGTEITNIVSKGNAAITASGTADNRATVIVEGTISDCAGKSGTVINAASNADVYFEDGAVITGNVSYDCSNHGIIKGYSGSVIHINGGVITGNVYHGNGLVGIYNASVVMNGGKICGNTYRDSVKGEIDDTDKPNGRGGVIYVHDNSKFTMNGGEICDNLVGISSVNGCGGAIDTLRTKHTGVTVTINGGTVKNNKTPSNAAYIPNQDYFGSADSAAHIYVGDEADVSGMVRLYQPGIEIDSWDPSYEDINNIP